MPCTTSAWPLPQRKRRTSDDRYKLIAKAHKELGFYYRNAGMWQEANSIYPVGPRCADGTHAIT